MYFTAAQITRSIQALGGVHPFHGITFLACKLGQLPVGEEIVFALDSVTDKFLQDHHSLDPGSDWFFQPFKTTDRTKKWVRPDYAPKGLQAVNTGSFLGAFIHARNSRIWAWNTDYVSFLAKKLPSGARIPSFDLAVWLYRDINWPDSSSLGEVVTRFLSDFHITDEEILHLFNVELPNGIDQSTVFQDARVNWEELRQFLPAPPDAKPDEGGTLSYLATRGIGPAHEFELEPAERLSLVTGDNGLGKSFLLEAAWWALTGTWAGQPVYPDPKQRNAKVEIAFSIAGERSKATRKTISFDWKSMSWPVPKTRPTIAGLIVFARVDGSFAVWDPARHAISADSLKRDGAVFTSAEVWDGLPGRIEGLIRDWVRWQNNPLSDQFKTFASVLAKLSPPDLGPLKPGSTVRIPDDPRDIPTLLHPYGETPVVYASAGVRRIVTLAYLVVWAWHEHLVAASMTQSLPQRRMVVLVDELEAHLHPKWQRSFLPALMGLNLELAPTLQAQYIVATHSPLVMASSESVFDDQSDKLFHLDMEQSGEISLKEVDYVAFGDVSSWLTSPVFELRHARSNEGEAAIEAAKALQLRGSGAPREIQAIHDRLKKHIASDDRFWPRWVAFAERLGVAI